MMTSTMDGERGGRRRLPHPTFPDEEAQRSHPAILRRGTLLIRSALRAMARQLIPLMYDLLFAEAYRGGNSAGGWAPNEGRFGLVPGRSTRRIASNARDGLRTDSLPG